MSSFLAVVSHMTCNVTELDRFMPGGIKNLLFLPYIAIQNDPSSASNFKSFCYISDMERHVPSGRAFNSEYSQPSLNICSQ